MQTGNLGFYTDGTGKPLKVPPHGKGIFTFVFSKEHLNAEWETDRPRGLD